MAFLKIEHVGKIYPKSENLLPALDDINIEVNNQGLVFVIGKSGSGKSTLMNLIGGLDAPTSGDITLKNRKYSELSAVDFDSLRRNEIGFVFQDFCLIDSLDVYENVRLAAVIKDEEVEKQKIYDAIKTVGLEGLEKRTVTNLSAGQRQRVAIARAIIKAPEVLLCDEPTGNLDFITSHEILKILKEISRKSLVIIVSHNLEDAYIFADRIIELKEGHIINDLVNDRKDDIVKDTAYISGIDFISKENLALINSGIKDGKIKQIQSKKELFKRYEHKDEEYEVKEYEDKHISLPKSFELMNKLLKKQFAKIGLFAFITALLSSIFAVCFMFVSYTPKTVYAQVSEQAEYLSPMFRRETDEHRYNANIAKFRESDFNFINQQFPNEPYYKMVAHNAFYSDSANMDGLSYPIYDGSSLGYYSSVIDRSLYVKETTGVLLTNENYLKKIFSQNELTYVATAEEIKNEGVYVTDFIVDQYIARKKSNKEYSDFVGQIVETTSNKKNTFNLFYINGIIKTDYQERFSEILEEINIARKYNPDAIKKISSSKRFYNYLQDAYSFYMPCYSFNPNYIQDYAQSSVKNYFRASRAVYKINYGGEEASIHNYANSSVGNIGLTSKLYNYNETESHTATKTMYFPYNIMNNIFSMNLTAEAWNEVLKSNDTVNVTLYDSNTNKETFNKNYKIVISDMTNVMLATQDVINDIALGQLVYSNIVFDRTDNIKNVFTVLAAKSYISYNISNSFPRHVSTGVEMYIDFFKILLAFSLVALTAVLAFVSYNNVRRFTYEIGVVKSLGARARDVYRIFSLQELYLLLGSMFMAVIGTYIATALSNTVLTAAFNKNFNPIYHISILFVDWKVLLVELAIIIVASIIAMIIPLLSMKRLRPIDILKAKY